MSRAGVERACFRLRDGTQLGRFRADARAYLEDEDLTSAEREAIVAGRVGELFASGISLGALEQLCRSFGYNNETYVRQLREATGRAIRADQIEVLRARDAARGRP